MKSHAYEFKPVQVLKVLGLPLVPLLLFAALMHGGAYLRCLPAPRPALDTDRTILIHQVEAARNSGGVELVLLGDSSCLMDVAACELGAQLGRRVLNLGTLSYLDLRHYAALLEQAASANTGTLRTVVLLMHPEALRRPAPETYHENLLRSILQGEEPALNGRPSEQFLALMGVRSFRSRVWRHVPAPLAGAFGLRYGFSTDLESYLAAHCGSAMEPVREHEFHGSAEYRLAPALEATSRIFRSKMPPGVALFAGITPAPETFVLRSYSEQCQQFLRTWTQWLQATGALAELPPTLPDQLFAKTTHLNAEGVERYTKLVAESLRKTGKW